MFIHIPRSGGTFLSRTLAEGLGYDKSFSVDLENISLEHFVEHQRAIVSSYKLVTGHVPFHFIAGQARTFDMIFSVVRSPLDRAISMFGYKNSDIGHLDDTELTQAFQAFVSAYYFGNIATRNEQCGYLGFDNTFGSVVSVLKEHSWFVLSHFDTLLATTRALLTHLSLPPVLAEDHNESGLDKRRIIPNLDTDFYAAFLSWFDGDYMLDNFVTKYGPLNAGHLVP
jgi:hypothetical protein